ncbi:hypothetical protein [Planomonospora sp. ID82291]|uniref:hypothetical protein n=1 Tax=Planomonospora sp. ID82291 TaxID=2738136 RepID=UPI0018C4248B|nr:hypothetical protein [Planomonospora sp. ID82291]MBG0818276.1 hypothetical protein [Planomonospora sp. ID82291]
MTSRDARNVLDELYPPRPRRDAPLDPGGIVDPATGQPRLSARKCSTCIFRPGNLMHLAPGRRDEMVTEALANNSWIICHATLPYGAHPEAAQAVCRGFYDVHGRASVGVRLVHALGGFTDTEPPTTTP